MTNTNKERIHDQALEVIGHFGETTTPLLEQWRTDHADQIVFARTVALNASAPKPLVIYDLRNVQDYQNIALNAVETLYSVERDEHLS